jgi:hypothetical protein
MTVRVELAQTFQLYCQALVRLLHRDNAALTQAEDNLLHQQWNQIKQFGYAVPETYNGGNVLHLKLSKDHHPGAGVMDENIHPGFTDKFLQRVSQTLRLETEHLQNYYLPEPNIYDLRNHPDSQGVRYVSVEWARWITLRNRACRTVNEIGMLAGFRIHELLEKEGKSPIREGESLKVWVDAPDAPWNGQDIPVRLYRLTQTEF